MSMENIGGTNGYVPSFGIPGYRQAAYQGGRAVPHVVAPFARPVAPEVLLVEAIISQWRIDLLRVHGAHAQRAAEAVRAGLVGSWLSIAAYPDWRIAQAEEYFGRLADAVEVAAVEDACERDRRRIERRCALTRERVARYRDRKRSA